MALSLTDRLYAQIGMCRCTYPLCERCNTLCDLITEVEMLRARLEHYEGGVA